MSFSLEKPGSPSRPPSLKKWSPSWSDLWLKNSKKSLKNHVVFTMQLQPPTSPTKKSSKTPTPNLPKSDRTLLLPDHLLLNILSKLPGSQRNPNSLVCKRWLNLQGRLVRSLRLFDWHFLHSGRLLFRFPNLTHVNLVSGCFFSPRNSGILLSHRVVSVHIGSGFSKSWKVCEDCLLPVEVVDRGIEVLASGCPNLRKLAVIGASELGLLSVAEECLTLQELELHNCNDDVLRGIAACTNLQVLRLVGNVYGFYSSVVSDIGLTILAQGCKRLVKLELCGCEGSFDGIKAIGQCCLMLEELTICDHRMDGGWLAGLSYCENLKTLRFQSCREIDPSPGPDEFLGCCPALERFHLQKCQLRDKKSVGAMFMMCAAVREMVFQDCWGLDNDTFSLAGTCRRVESLSLEGCSLLTTEGLGSVLLSWKELQSLSVVSCKNIKDSEISLSLSTFAFKELKWRPDTKSLLRSSLVGTGMGKKGSKFFNKRM